MTTQTAPDTDSVDLAEFRSTIRAFANAEIHPGAAARDESKEFPAQLVKRLGQQDLMGISVPEEFGGLGLSTRTQLVAIEEVARTDAALASIYTAHYLGLEPILVGGSEEQKHRWLPQLASGELLAGFALTEPDAGSDIASMRTVARREDDGWHLSGSKTYISNAKEADLVVLFAKTDPSAGFRGITAFVVPKGTPGISYSEPQDKMGIRSAPTYTVYLDDVVLPLDSVIGTEGRGGNSALTALNRARIDVAAMANGIAARLGTGTRVRNGAKAVRHADLRLPGNPATPRWLRRATCRITRHRRLGRRRQGRRSGHPPRRIDFEVRRHRSLLLDRRSNRTDPRWRRFHARIGNRTPVPRLPHSPHLRGHLADPVAHHCRQCSVAAFHRVLKGADMTALPPLDGIRVIDLSRVLAGPYCTALLSDAGADVVKIESEHGEDSRHLGPFRDGESIYFNVLNRGKRSVALNLKNDEDREALLTLIETADVVVENFRPGVTKRLGIDYEAARARNPRIVYASISGFGQDGPMSGAAAYDLVVQALSGIMSITGSEESGPTRLGESFGDLVAGLFAAWGISTALLSARASGLGQHLDVAMFDSMLAMLPTAHSQLQSTGLTPPRVGNRHPVSTPFDTYKADDGLFVLAVASQSGFEKLAQTMDRVDLIADPRFADDTARTENEPALRKEIENWAAGKTVTDVVGILGDAGLAGSEIWDVQQALTSAQAEYRGVVESFEHPVAGKISYVRQPVVFGDSRRPDVRRSPLLDEHHGEVLPGSR